MTNCSARDNETITYLMRDDFDSYIIKALARALQPAVTEAVKQSVARAIDPTIVNLIQYAVGKELEGSLRVNLERTLKDLTNEAARRYCEPRTRRRRRRTDLASRGCARLAVLFGWR
jgi:hypothetical protein